MARIRTLKPEFWDHAQLNRASLLARLTFVGLISLADDQGRGRADSSWLWGQLHSGQPPNVVRLWSKCLVELAQLQDDDGPLVIFYEVAGARYYWLPGFSRQQYIEKAGKSKLPEPPNSGNIPLLVPDHSPLEQGSGNRDQGAGRGSGGTDGEAPPSSAPPGTSGTLGANVLADAETREVDRSVAAFGFCAIPGTKAKAMAISDLRRQGVSHEFIRAIAANQDQKDFYEIIRSIQKGKATPAFKASESKPKTCARCGGTGQVVDHSKTPLTSKNTAFKPCPDCRRSA